MPSWQCQEERRQWQRSHRHLQTYQIDGDRHRLGVAAHLAGKVGEALRPGPPHSDYADELTECLQMLDEGMNVVWDPGMNARLARIRLAEHVAIPALSGPIRTDDGSRDLPGTDMTIGRSRSNTETDMTIGPSRSNTDNVGYDSSREWGSHRNHRPGSSQERLAAAASTSTAADNSAAGNDAEHFTEVDMHIISTSLPTTHQALTTLRHTHHDYAPTTPTTTPTPTPTPTDHGTDHHSHPALTTPTSTPTAATTPTPPTAPNPVKKQ